MSQPSDHLSGAYGIVAIPDVRTQERSCILAKMLLGNSASYYLGENDLPHLTLYHGKIVNAPIDFIKKTQNSISELLRGYRLKLSALGFAGSNFLFWDVDGTTDQGQLQQAHQMALGLAQFLDKTSEAKATSEEGLNLSPEELNNILRYGHPWVGKLYRPHITLGFGVNLEHTTTLPVLKDDWELEVSSVEIAQIGFPGRIEQLLIF